MAGGACRPCEFRPGAGERSRRVAVAIKQTPFALDSATVRRLHAEARREGVPELVVISLTASTDLARDLAAHTPGLTVLGESDDLDA